MLRRLALSTLLWATAATAESGITVDPPIDCHSCTAWNRPLAPFHVFGNTYYVGVAGVSAVLIDAGDELLLIDGGLPQTAAIIVANIRALGFEPKNISTLLLSHAHFDHAGGLNALQRYTGAEVWHSPSGAKALRAGDLMPDDPQFDQPPAGRVFPAIADVVEVADGQVYRVGDVRIRALFTPGHTPGGMSWTWQSCEQDRCLDVVYADSLGPVSMPGYRFSDGLGAAVAASAERVAALDCDLLLVTHPFLIQLEAKLDQGRENLIDATACARYGEATLQSLQQRLAQESGAD